MMAELTANVCRRAARTVEPSWPDPTYVVREGFGCAPT
jgi:hypothetical protein